MKSTSLFLDPPDFPEPPGYHNVRCEQQRTFAKGASILKSYLLLGKTVLVIALAFLILLLSYNGVQAATITVTSAADSGAGTLRQAILNAISGDIINFALPSGTTAINLTSDELLINKSLTISGPGANFLSVQRSAAADSFRIFNISATAINVSIAGLTIANGLGTNSDPGGGGIRVSVTSGGTVTINSCTITGNTGSHLAGITAGGGIFNNAGTLTVNNSTISNNTGASGHAAQGYGGGIFNNTGTTNIANSTISGNTATRGGGISNDGTITITNSTISGNSSSSSAGGINNNSATVNARNTIIATNTAPTSGQDFFGTLTSQGYNLIGNTNATTITGTTTGNQLNVDPMLGPLQDNGGPTFTQALLSGSTAIEGGGSGGPGTDQRGFTRPVDSPAIGNATGGNGSDIGAYEVQGDQLPGCGNTIVTNNNDSGSGSLRSIVANACAGETITFASSVVSPIKLASELLVDKPLTIQGPAANVLTVQRDNTLSAKFRVFHLTANGQVNISGLTISQGNGGIYNEGSTLTVVGCAISGNYSGAENGFGGGILAGGTLNVIGSTVSNNGALLGGGGIAHLGFANITNSTISGNFASGGNPQHGGGILSLGPLNLTNCTVANNSSVSGGGIYNDATTVSSRNSIIAKNTAPTAGPDFDGTLTSQGFNFIGNSSGATITPAQFSDQIGTAASPKDPLLGSLQNNGGTTMTQALLPGSTAIDKGGSATDPITGSPIMTDQRGATRPLDDPNVANASGGDGSDIGAFEVRNIALIAAASRKTHGATAFDLNLPLTGSPAVECRSSGGNHTLVFTFSNNITSGSVNLTSSLGPGHGSVSGSPTFSGQTMTVNLTGVTDVQTVTVTLSNVTDVFAQVLPDTSVKMNVLVGDTSGNSVVNASDVALTKSQSGQPVSAANFREDVTVNNIINSSDVSLVKSRSGSGVATSQNGFAKPAKPRP